MRFFLARMICCAALAVAKGGAPAVKWVRPGIIVPGVASKTFSGKPTEAQILPGTTLRFAQ
jgi:hypothetical protein